jgi:hypothetical protein
VKIARGPSGSKRLRIDRSGSATIVPSAVQERLNREELRFMLATTLGKPPLQWLLAFPVVGLAPLLAIPLATPFGPHVLAMTCVVIVCVLCATLPLWFEFFRRATTYNQMDAALRATLNPKAGASALTKLGGETKSRKALGVKLSCLRRAARAQGLPDPPDPLSFAPSPQASSTTVELHH